MNPVDTVPLMLIVLHLLALGVVMIIFLGMIALHRRTRVLQETLQGRNASVPSNPESTPLPATWLAIRSSNPKGVQAALAVSYPTPCRWTEGLAGKHEFFIGAPVNNWIIVTGSGLPQPGHDVDRAFYFLIRLSRVLGHIQFFVADSVQHHHAWARVENGCVKRAYAWAGETVWDQGAKSMAEIELTMKCFGYGEGAQTDDAAMENNAAANVKKVPSLAGRWSVNPLSIDQDWQNAADGIAGKSSLFYQD